MKNYEKRKYDDRGNLIYLRTSTHERTWAYDDDGNIINKTRTKIAVKSEK